MTCVANVWERPMSPEAARAAVLDARSGLTLHLASEPLRATRMGVLVGAVLATGLRDEKLEARLVRLTGGALAAAGDLADDDVPDGSTWPALAEGLNPELYLLHLVGEAAKGAWLDPDCAGEPRAWAQAAYREMAQTGMWLLTGGLSNDTESGTVAVSDGAVERRTGTALDGSGRGDDALRGEGAQGGAREPVAGQHALSGLRG